MIFPIEPKEINVEELGHDKVAIGAIFVLFNDIVTTGGPAENQIFMFYMCLLNAEKESLRLRLHVLFFRTVFVSGTFDLFDVF